MVQIIKNNCILLVVIKKYKNKKQKIIVIKKLKIKNKISHKIVYS